MELIQADNTAHRADIELDINRFDRSNLPVNILIPADPDQPLIMMPEVISPADALKALDFAANGKKFAADGAE